MMRRFVKPAFMCLALLLVALLIPARAFALDSEPELTEAKAAIVCDAAGNVLWSREADMQLEPASITKVMTAMVALDSDVPLDQVCQIVAPEIGGNSQTAGYQPGDEPTFEELLRVMLIYSGNDAAANVAWTVAGSEEAFVELMNQKAEELGMTGTHFANPHGLMAEGHYSTARDLALMGRYAMENYPFIAQTVHMREIEAHVGGGTQVLPSTDDLMPVYEGLLGIKTGAVESGTAFLGASKRDDTALFTCVLGCATSEGRFEDTRRLMDWAYGVFRHETLLPASLMTDVAPYALGFSQKVYVHPAADLRVTSLPEGELEAYGTKVPGELMLDASAPVGSVWYRQQGNFAGGAGLTTSEPVAHVGAVNYYQAPLF